MIYRVSADIHMTQGALAGLILRGGWNVTASTPEGAMAYADWADDRHFSGEEVDGIGNHYRVVSHARIDVVAREG